VTHWSELVRNPLKSSMIIAELEGDTGASRLLIREARAMPLTQLSERPARPGSGARAARRALRAEKAQLLRWRRLVRARLDLAVAAFAPPDTLGAMSWDLVPDAQMNLPTPHDLLNAIRLPAGADQVALMRQLRDLDRRLAAYGAEIDAALEVSTHQIVHQLASPDASSGDRQAP
jgi:hypothetical protein